MNSEQQTTIKQQTTNYIPQTTNNIPQTTSNKQPTNNRQQTTKETVIYAWVLLKIHKTHTYNSNNSNYL